MIVATHLAQILPTRFESATADLSVLVAGLLAFTVPFTTGAGEHTEERSHGEEG